MIRINLPNIFSNYKLNRELINIYRQHSDWFYDNIAISDVTGNFNWCIASGERFSNIDTEQPDYKSIYNNIFEYVSFSNVNIDFDFSNQNYTGSYDNYCDIILTLGNNGSNRIEISNTEVMDKLHEQYPDYHFIISENAHINNINELKVLIENPLIDIIYIERSLINDIINHNIPTRKLGLLINPSCPLNCENLGTCQNQHELNQYSYSIKNIYNECSKCLDLFDNYQIYSISYISDTLYSRGFHWFKFSTFSNLLSKEQIIQFLVHYLVRPEFINNTIDIFKNGGII